MVSPQVASGSPYLSPVSPRHLTPAIVGEESVHVELHRATATTQPYLLHPQRSASAGRGQLCPRSLVLSLIPDIHNSGHCILEMMGARLPRTFWMIGSGDICHVTSQSGSMKNIFKTSSCLRLLIGTDIILLK